MRKSEIKKLASASYTKNKLDEKKVNRVSKHLKNNDLRAYIKDLKTLESKKTVNITLPNSESVSIIKGHFAKIYPDKRIVFSVDPTLLTGIKVVDYDNEYELSLKGFLEGGITHTND